MSTGAQTVSVYEQEQEAWFALGSRAARVLACLPTMNLRAGHHAPAEAPNAAVGFDADGLRDTTLQVSRLDWKAYLAAVDVTDDRTPRERLQEYFG